MLSFLGLTQQPTQPEKKMGDLKEDKNIGEQLNELKGKVERTMNKNKSELRNYRELSKYNEHLSKSYSANLKIIVDISKLLAAYNEFFDLFKSKLAEIDQELGIPISSDDFEYMKKLTTDQMMMMNETFKKETGNLKKLYAKYGKQKEYQEVESAEMLFDKTRESGQQTYNMLKTSNPPPVTASLLGGKKKRSRKTKNLINIFEVVNNEMKTSDESCK
jgi:hypothetical protein